MFMKRIGVLMLTAMVLLRCEGDSEPCDELATVRDLTGLDGCGFVFVLEDGTRLEPVRLMYCGTPPLPKEVTEDPLYNFEFRDGKKVFISYEITEGGSYCMVGPVVKITCLIEILATSGD
jgi:hypothetical protein